jgi:bacterioferritin-associated ferredoxin
MIVCSCTLITSNDIAEAVASLRSHDPFVVLTPGLIYRHLGKRPSCGNCLPLITRATGTTTATAPSALRDTETDPVTAASLSIGRAEGLLTHIGT